MGIFEGKLERSLFRITMNFLGICTIVIFISLIGFIQPVDASTTTTQLEYPWQIIVTTPLGYSGEQEYKAYLQTVVRDKNNQLVSVTESINIWKVPTFLPDNEPAPLWMDTVFYYTLKENYQTVIIDGIKYEKVEYFATFESTRADSYLWLCADIQVYGNLCMKVFYARSPMVYLEDGNILTEKWTILRHIS